MDNNERSDKMKDEKLIESIIEHRRRVRRSKTVRIEEKRILGEHIAEDEFNAIESNEVKEELNVKPVFARIIFKDPTEVEVNDINNKEVYLEVINARLWISLVNPVFFNVVEDVIVDKVESKIWIAAEDLKYQVKLPSIIFCLPTAIEVDNVNFDIKIPERIEKLEAKLVPPRFRELKPEITFSTLVITGIPKSLRATLVERRLKGSYHTEGKIRSYGITSYKLEAASELVGLANDFFELELYGVDLDENLRKLSFGNLLTFERPIVLLVPEPKEGIRNYERLLLSLLREVYRMTHKGLPRPLVISEFRNIYWRADEIYATESIGFIDFRDLKEQRETGLDQLRDKVAELFSQGFGFLVISYKDGEESEVLKMLYNVSRESALKTETSRENKLILHGIPAHVIKVTPKVILPNKIDKIWGRILEPRRPETSERYSLTESVNIYSLKAEKRYYHAIARIASSTISQLEVPVNPEGETLVHYALKSIAYMYLKYALGYNNTQAESGCGAEEARVDVCSEDVIVEIETLYGRGLPLRRLVEVIESRKDLLNTKRELWIIIPPPQASILPREWLKAFKEYVKEKYPEKIRLATVDIDHSMKLAISLEKNRKIKFMEKELNPITELEINN